MRRLWWAALVVVAVLVAACGGSGGDDKDGASENGASDQVLRILVTNDDGVAGEGIDALVRGLETLEDAEVTVVAPAEDQSGTSDSMSNPPPTASDAALIGGHEAVAVAGYPADAVLYALDPEVLEERPHVVVSGVNLGQNLGPVAYVSGTVGAARTAAREGIPALAVSQGLADAIDYQTGVRLALDWLEENRDALLRGDIATDTIANLNVPSCATGELRGVVEVDSAADAGTRNILANADCASTQTDPDDDVEGFLNGYATLSEVPINPPG